MLADNPELRKVFAVWICEVVLRRSKHAVVLPKIDAWSDRVLDAQSLDEVLRVS